MTPIRTFVGHSFLAEDEEVVTKFLSYFTQIKGVLPNFEWEHAKAAEPTELAAKVLKLVEGKNTFIGICTKRERVVAEKKIRSSVFNSKTKVIAESDLDWKTSDSIIAR